MIAKVAAAALLLLAPVSAAEQAPLVFVQYPLVHKVSCLEGSGTAFRVGRNHWLSVAHVTAMHACSIDGEPITVTKQDGARDFSMLDTPRSVPNGFKINCDGYRAGDWVWAVGHAKGLPFHTALAVYVTYAKTADGKRVLIGPHAFIPGMSGGPVLNAKGEVVGLVNAYLPGTPISLSRDLRDTAACDA